MAAVLEGFGYAVRLRYPREFDNMRFRDSAVGAVLCLVVSHSLNVTAFCDELAKSLGGNVVRTRVLSLIAVTLLAGAATAGAGPIGFVGRVVIPPAELPAGIVTAFIGAPLEKYPGPSAASVVCCTPFSRPRAYSVRRSGVRRTVREPTAVRRRPIPP